jgi:hypothetical protein
MQALVKEYESVCGGPMLLNQVRESVVAFRCHVPAFL